MGMAYEKTMSADKSGAGDSSLSAWIDSQQPFLGSNWVSALDDRKREEAEFHDADRAGNRNERADSSSNRRFYAAARPLRDAIDAWINEKALDSIFLDYACGDGTQAIRAAKAGARLSVGIDISEVSVRNALQSANDAGVAHSTRFLQRDCENTGFPESSFDACLCSGMLHHLDLAKAFPELARIMRPGGRILCVEALSYNPFIQLYRELTPELRTDWEKRHILGMREVRFAKRWFNVANMRFFNLVSPLATFLPEGQLRENGLRLTQAVDSLLTRVPGLRLWSWVFAFELVKPDTTRQ
jgi:SAM-dependent methyltransferase